MKYSPITIYHNFKAFKDDAFFSYRPLDVFEFIKDYIFSDYYKNPKNYLWYKD